MNAVTKIECLGEYRVRAISSDGMNGAYDFPECRKEGPDGRTAARPRIFRAGISGVWRDDLAERIRYVPGLAASRDRGERRF
jgi:hypothetical protein